MLSRQHVWGSRLLAIVPSRFALRHLASGALGFGLVWLGLNLVPVSSPAPLWTQADLGVDADEHGNAWDRVADPATSIQWPDDLAKSVVWREHPPEAFWQAARQRAATVDTLIQTPEAQALLAQIELAADSPTFAERHGDATSSRSIHWHGAHELALAAVIRQAQHGDLDGATERLTQLLRLDAKVLANPRSYIGLAVGLGNLRGSLHVANMLAFRANADAPVPCSTHRALAELTTQIRALELETLELEGLVHTEYVYIMQLLETLEQGETPPALSKLSVSSSLLLNRGLTMRELNFRFARRYFGALAHDTNAALGCEEISPKASPGWWVHNATGDSLLDAISPSNCSLSNKLDEARAAASSARAHFLAD